MNKKEFTEDKSKCEILVRVYSYRERRELVARMCEIAVKECFRNPLYKYNTKYYVQKDGVAIGLHLTGIVAEHCMASWEKRFREMLKEKLVRLLMSDVYINDQNLLFQVF